MSGVIEFCENARPVDVASPALSWVNVFDVSTGGLPTGWKLFPDDVQVALVAP